MVGGDDDPPRSLADDLLDDVLVGEDHPRREREACRPPERAAVALGPFERLAPTHGRVAISARAHGPPAIFANLQEPHRQVDWRPLQVNASLDPPGTAKWG
jgi:hypothetical protein